MVVLEIAYHEIVCFLGALLFLGQRFAQIQLRLECMANICRVASNCSVKDALLLIGVTRKLATYCLNRQWLVLLWLSPSHLKACQTRIQPWRMLHSTAHLQHYLFLPVLISVSDERVLQAENVLTLFDDIVTRDERKMARCSLDC